MGRRKTKKPKSGGGVKHASGPRAAEGPTPAAAIPAEVPGMVEAVGACAAPATQPIATTPTPAPPAAAEPKQRSSPRRSTGGRVTLNSNKVLQRAQIQGELNSLEAQLAAVEDLQARMAAKLSNVDSNIVDGTVHAVPTAASATPNVPGTLTTLEKDSVPKTKKNKKSKQDKALKQEENLKEAQQMKAETSQKVEPVVDVKRGCDVESWEDIEQVELVWEGKQGEKEPVLIKQSSSNKQVDEDDDDSDEDLFCMMEPLTLGDDDKTETKVEEKKPDVNLVLEGKGGGDESKKETQADIIKASPTSEKPSPEVMLEVKVKKESEDDDSVEKKILEDYSAEKDFGGELDKALASEIAGYLMADYNRMINLRLALDAECQTALISVPSKAPTEIHCSEELTPKKIVQYFSYADAVKASLPHDVTDDTTKVITDEEQLTGGAVPGLTKMSDLPSDEATHVYHYMKSEYEPCLRRKEAEEAERVYHETAAEKDHVDNNTGSEVPRIEVCLAGTPEGSDEEVGMKGKKEVDKTDKADLAIAEALALDYNQMKMMSLCRNAEIEYHELLNKAAPSTTLSCCGQSLPMQVEAVNQEVAKCLKEECDRMASHKSAISGEESHHAQSDDARHAEAVRRAEVLEAATMEVEYEEVERQYRLQQERRNRAWRWVRADTAPAHIDVPETVHEPVSSDAEAEEPDTQSTSVLTDMHGLVFQCQDACTQTDKLSEQERLDFHQRIQDERVQRMALQKYVQVLEQELKDQREKVAEHRKMTNQLENSISDKKAEASEARMIAAEYKSRCTDLEHSLDTARSVVNNLEDQVETSHRLSSGVDYMLEANLEKTRAAEAQAKIDDLETKLLLSKAEVQQLLDKLSDRTKQLDMMPVIVHQQHMQKAEAARHELQLKVTQLEVELSQLRNVRDVWGSCQNPATLPGGSLAMGFPVTGVDLPPVPGVTSSCLSGLHLGSSPPKGTTSLTSGLLSGLSDLQTKATPVVAPLALQEDMDSDDDVSWSSASEHLRDSRANSTPGAPLRGLQPRADKSPRLPSNPLLGQHDCHKPQCGLSEAHILPAPAASLQQQLPKQSQPKTQPQLQAQPQQANQTSAPPKPKGNKKRNRTKKTQK